MCFVRLMQMPAVINRSNSFRVHHARATAVPLLEHDRSRA